MQNKAKYELHQNLGSKSDGQIASPLSQLVSKEKNLHKQASSSQNRKPLSSSYEHKCRVKNENWDISDIQKLFTLYGEYGSEWKIIQIQFTDKSSNSIKNRFYTVVRTLLKILFRQHPHILNKLPNEIPSKTILKFFQGRQEFEKFKGFGKKILKAVNYNLESKNFSNVIDEYSNQIQTLHQIIFSEECSDSKKSHIKKNRSKIYKSMKNQMQNDAQAPKSMQTLMKSEAREQINSPSTEILGSAQGKESICQEKQVNSSNYIIIPSVNYYTLYGYHFLPYF